MVVVGYHRKVGSSGREPAILVAYMLICSPPLFRTFRMVVGRLVFKDQLNDSNCLIISEIQKFFYCLFAIGLGIIIFEYFEISIF